MYCVQEQHYREPRDVVRLQVGEVALFFAFKKTVCVW